MQINISGHQLQLTESLKKYAQEKLKRLERYYDKIINLDIIMETEKIIQKIEGTLYFSGGSIIASAENENMYIAIDILEKKLERQLIKHKEKKTNKLHHKI